MWLSIMIFQWILRFSILFNAYCLYCREDHAFVLSLILNLILHQMQDYVHRVGRTARAGQSGYAVSFVNQYESLWFKMIEALLGNSFPCCLSPLHTWLEISFWSHHLFSQERKFLSGRQTPMRSWYFVSVYPIQRGLHWRYVLHGAINWKCP